MLIVIDNFDSFTYNLVQYLGEMGESPVVYRNNAIGVAELERLNPTRLVMSPGPGQPQDAGVTMAVIKAFAGRVPILGVCLGHQAIGAVFGGRIVRAPTPVHGKTSKVDHDGKGVFRGLQGPLTVGRYHSLVVAEEAWPDDLEIAGRSQDDGVVMALRHRRWAVHGVQFHPESVLTADGRQVLRNFLSIRQET